MLFCIANDDMKDVFMLLHHAHQRLQHFINRRDQLRGGLVGLFDIEQQRQFLVQADAGRV
ncbi:hypothetical protein D3C80_2142540 [compost metagenome]